ncbi:MAG: winged helix-turn-helix transcriptional regulator [Crenarchaeota archaeon]|nr:winged helix-turn-helix transcriptional regulator [Thermoproteota archaeon]
MEAEERLREIRERYRDVLTPNRFAVLLAVYALGPQPLSVLAKVLGMGWGELDSALRKLREKGLVVVRKRIVGRSIRSVAELTEEGEKLVEDLAELFDSIKSGRRSGRSRER